MEAFTPWLTPALLVALVAWLRSELISRTEKLDKRFDGVDKRFDGVTREIADLRERMARLEGALEGFLAAAVIATPPDTIAGRSRGESPRCIRAAMHPA